MKVSLGQGTLTCTVLVALLAMGCGGSGATAKPVSATSAVSTTELMAAELHDGVEAPRVGKQQRAEPSDEIEESTTTKDASQRHGERKSGGGFSGYK